MGRWSPPCSSIVHLHSRQSLLSQIVFHNYSAPSSSWSSSSSSLSHFYVESIWDDSRLRAARSYTSTPDSPFSLRSSFTRSAHLFFGLPLLPLPCTSMPIILFPTCSSSLLIACPYHRIMRSWTVFEISPTAVSSHRHPYLHSFFLFLLIAFRLPPMRSRALIIWMMNSRCNAYCNDEMALTMRTELF